MRALAKIVQREPGQRDAVPCERDGASAEMAHVGVERFDAGDREHHRPEHRGDFLRDGREQTEPEHRIDGLQHDRVLDDPPEAERTRARRTTPA